MVGESPSSSLLQSPSSSPSPSPSYPVIKSSTTLSESINQAVSTLFGGEYVAHGLLVLVQLSCSGYHILSSVALKNGADALLFALYRELLGSIFMFVYAHFCLKIPLKDFHIQTEDRLRFLVIGFLSFVNVVGTILSLQYISPARYSLMQPLIPCIATFVSIIIKIEIFTLIKLVGILIAVAGALTVELWNEAPSTAAESNVSLGTSIVACQITAMACVVTFQKSLLCKYEPAVLAFVYYTIGTVFTIIMFVCWYSRVKDISGFYMDGKLLPWLALAYASIVATLFNTNAQSWCVKRLPPSISTIYCTIQPLGTCILSVTLLHTMFTINQGVGGLLTIAGLFVTLYGRSREVDSSSNSNKAVIVSQDEDIDTKVDVALSTPLMNEYA